MTTEPGGGQANEAMEVAIPEPLDIGGFARLHALQPPGNRIVVGHVGLLGATVPFLPTRVTGAPEVVTSIPHAGIA